MWVFRRGRAQNAAVRRSRWSEGGQVDEAARHDQRREEGPAQVVVALGTFVVVAGHERVGVVHERLLLGGHAGHAGWPDEGRVRADTAVEDGARPDVVTVLDVLHADGREKLRDALRELDRARLVV